MCACQESIWMSLTCMISFMSSQLKQPKIEHQENGPRRQNQSKREWKYSWKQVWLGCLCRMPVVCIVLLPGMFSPGLSDSWGWCAMLKGIVQTKSKSLLLWQIESQSWKSALKCSNICICSEIPWMERIPPNKWRGEWWTPKKKTSTCLHTVIEMRTFDYCIVALHSLFPSRPFLKFGGVAQVFFFQWIKSRRG